MPHLTEARSNGLALWTFGTITAQSGRQNSFSKSGMRGRESRMVGQESGMTASLRAYPSLAKTVTIPP